ncbi:site-specific integrase [Aquibacillus albus]|uniref:Integrase n=1 Tax=Aquibacillus albus TaxID=1168171 RepID=A0ABS2N097_9BACI|nr:site-specific integrase [Aquibacillus albus]MBM7571564.1 integrase [Aquibacillus albus]
MRGSYKKNPDGTWSFRVNIGINPKTGKRIQKYKSGFRTKKDAQNEATRILLEVNDGTFFEESPEQFNVYISRWFNTSYKRSVEESTATSRWYLIDKHLIPAFYHRKLNEISPFEIDSFYADKIDNGYSPAYIRQMHNVLNQSFQQAVKWRLIKNNPVQDTSPPKVRNKEKQVWNVDQVNHFIKVIDNHHTKIPYVLAIYTGMRRGEILGLKWSDVDLDKGKINIKRSLCFISKKGLTFKEPKTSKSKRQISISKQLIKMLMNHKEYREGLQVKFGIAYVDNDMVVSTDDGKPMDPRNLLRQFYLHMEKAKLPKLSFHDLRHTHATILMQIGENPKVVSERLGHSRVGITLDLYSHVSDDLQERAAEKFEETLFKKRNSPPL